MNQTEMFSNELDALIERCRQEYELTYAEMVGAMSFKIHTLNREAEEMAKEE